MPKPNLRAVNKEQIHARDIAAQRVKRWRSNAEKERLPIVTLTGETPLPVDDILKGSLREMPDVEEDKSFPWIAIAAIVGGLIGILWLFTS